MATVLQTAVGNTIQNLVQPAGIEPASIVLQTTAMTTSAKVAYKIGADYRI